MFRLYHFYGETDGNPRLDASASRFANSRVSLALYRCTGRNSGGPSASRSASSSHSRFRQSIQAFSRDDRQCVRPAQVRRLRRRQHRIRYLRQQNFARHVAPSVLRCAFAATGAQTKSACFGLRQQVEAVSEFGGPSEPRLPRQSPGAGFVSHNAVGDKSRPGVCVAPPSIFCWAATRWAISRCEKRWRITSTPHAE
jgi:hypothetical protein